MKLNHLAEVRNYLTVAHHVPGRIRVKFKLTLAGHPLIKEITQSDLPLPEGIVGTRLNLFARSVVVDYDPDMISPELLDEMLRTEDDRRAMELVQEFEKKLMPAGKNS